ncbi:hypothetical protein [Streptomyces sp. NPDC023838]|uniref:hypothetical protein n=1 Tax=Streptomyces sp. NPDC023838 TaxID=3154325 RepID=UPI0033D1650F
MVDQRAGQLVRGRRALQVLHRLREELEALRAGGHLGGGVQGPADGGRRAEPAGRLDRLVGHLLGLRRLRLGQRLGEQRPPGAPRRVAHAPAVQAPADRAQPLLGVAAQTARQQQLAVDGLGVGVDDGVGDDLAVVVPVGQLLRLVHPAPGQQDLHQDAEREPLGGDAPADPVGDPQPAVDQVLGLGEAAAAEPDVPEG